MAKKLILLSAKAGSGKTYIANLLMNRGWYHIAIADVLKKRVSLILGVDENVFHNKKERSYKGDITYRDLLIKYAKIIKSRDQDHFVRKAIEKINKHNDLVVISDVRYPHEVDYIRNNVKDYDIKVVKIIRNNHIEIQDQSETSMDDFQFDHTVINEVDFQDNKLADNVLQVFS